MEKFEHRVEEDDDMKSVQKESIEQWKQSGVTLMEGLRQVVAGASVSRRVKRTGSPCGVPKLSVGVERERKDRIS